MADIGKILAAQAPRDIGVITAEILELKQNAGEAIIGIGQRLNEAKRVLPHGEWLPWLTEKVEFSDRVAQQFMKLAREWSNPKTLSDLGKSKALTLLALPEQAREEFIQETHTVNGEEKSVVDMTSRELEKAIRERREALEAKETAEANKRLAEESRAKMEQDMAMERELLEAANKTVEDLQNQLEKLKAAPVEVAVMEVDQQAIEKAKAEAVAAVQAQLEKAQEKAKKAGEKLAAQENEIAALRQDLEAAKKTASAAAVSADKDMATFEVWFQQSQEIANKMAGLLIKLRGREDKTAAVVEKAMKALAAAIGRAVGQDEPDEMKVPGQDDDTVSKTKCQSVWRKKDVPPEDGQRIIYISDDWLVDNDIYQAGQLKDGPRYGTTWNDVILWTPEPELQAEEDS